MTLFGMIWMMLLLFCFFSKLEYMVAITIVSSILQCDNVVSFDGIVFGPQIITSIALIIKSLLYNSLKLRIHKNGYLIQSTMIAVFLTVLVSSAYNGVLSGVSLRIVQLFIYILCAFSMRQCGYKIDDGWIYSLLRKVTIVVLIIGAIQFLITSSILPRLGIFDVLFYNENSRDVYYYSNNYYRIMSTFMEPSYFAAFIVGAFYYFLTIKEERRNNKYLLFAILAEIILSFSSSAYGAFIIAGVLFIVSSKEGKFKLGLVLSAVVGFLIMYFVFYKVLDNVIFSKMSSNSGVGRYYLNQEAISYFHVSPIIGNGYKTSRASSLLYTLLAEVGFIGLGFYFLLNSQIVLPSIFKRKSNPPSNQYIGLSIAVISAVIVQLIAVPDLDNCSYWMWINLLFLYLGSRDASKYCC